MYFFFIMERKDFDLDDSGIQSNSLVKAAFDKAALVRLKDNIYRKTETVKHIFVSVDPAAGGARSKFAIVSCIYPRAKSTKMVVRNFPQPSYICLVVSYSISLSLFIPIKMYSR